MKKGNAAIMLIVLIAMTFVVSSCTKKDVEPAKTSYDLVVKDVLGVSGTATIIETSSTSATIEIELNGAPAGTHPAELRSNSAVENSVVIAVLNPVDATGKSKSTISTKTYKQLQELDGHIVVRQSAEKPNVILAIGDIGGNVLTATKKSYEIKEKDAFGVKGTALFQKRTNGNTLVTISLSGVIAGQSYPASINIGSVATVGGGDVKRSLNNVDGDTGKSYTNIKALNDGTIIKYEDWLVYQGYINIYQNSVANTNIIAQGDIGSNAAVVK